MSISYHELGRAILLGETMEDKLLTAEVIWDEWKPHELPKSPGRRGKLSFSEKQMKFPKSSRLSEDDKKAVAIHSFANHELLAIEMMAASLLIYPHRTDDDVRWKRGVLTALRDEQRHLNLYVTRLEELGYGFGDFPLNDFFWKQMGKLETPSQYLAVMALTFESANLDFAQHYARIFREFGDERTAGILEQVLEDEMAHVAFASHWMKRWRGDRTLWQYYLDSLPWPLTPARSKGIGFDPGLHARAVGDAGFARDLEAYQDDYKITKRQGQ